MVSRARPGLGLQQTLGLAAGHPRLCPSPCEVPAVLLSHRLTQEGRAPLCKCPSLLSGLPDGPYIDFWFVLGC